MSETRPYVPPAFVGNGSVDAQLAEIRVVVTRQDRDVHSLLLSRDRADQQAVRIEERVEQIQSRLAGLDRLEEAVAVMRSEQDALKKQLAKVGGLLGGGLLLGQVLLQLLGLGG